MDAEQIKANRIKWLEELESGKWHQARAAWRGNNIHQQECHCCLDVANCLFASDRDYNGPDQHVYRKIFEEATAASLGIPFYADNDVLGSMEWFVNMNDVIKCSFEEIAAAARQHWNLPKE